MEQIFAPWRMEWVSRDEQDPDFEGCVFCGLSETADEQSHRIVARNDHAFAVLNNAPYNPGHLLVVPNAHGGDYADLSTGTVAAMAKLQQECIAALETAFDPDGYNVGMNLDEAGGASITAHVHVHVVPRWASDTTFMPTTANTSVIVESLDQTYDRLRKAFETRDEATTSRTGSAVRFASPTADE